MRALTSVVHECGWSCSLQSHHTTRLDPKVTFSGPKLSFLTGSHCAAMSGAKAARDLQTQGERPAHTGQPVLGPLARLFTCASHTWGCPHLQAVHSHVAL